VPVGARSSWWT